MRVFNIDPATSKLTESTPLKAPAGSGPRHGSFLAVGDTTYFFLVTEMDVAVISYVVTYNADSTLSFNQVFTSGLLGNKTIPSGASAAECILSVSFP